MTFEKRKYWLVEDIFIKTADEDYLLARWCYFNDMHRQFFWHAAQATEKYLKASLVLNDHSIKDISHQLSESFKRVKVYGNEFLPSLKQPSQNLIFSKNPNLWKNETLESFITRIECHGTPSNRYDYFGVYLEITDLYKLDQLIFSLRNLSVNLNDIYDDVDDNHEYKGFTYSKILRLKPNSQLFQFDAKLINDKRYCKSLYDLARDNNYVFASEYDHTITPLKINSKVSNLEMLYAGNHLSYATETRKWFEDNFKKLSKADEQRLAK
jgi:HEPN domain-containing protein